MFTACILVAVPVALSRPRMQFLHLKPWADCIHDPHAASSLLSSMARGTLAQIWILVSGNCSLDTPTLDSLCWLHVSFNRIIVSHKAPLPFPPSTSRLHAWVAKCQYEKSHHTEYFVSAHSDGAWSIGAKPKVSTCHNDVFVFSKKCLILNFSVLGLARFE